MEQQSHRKREAEPPSMPTLCANNCGFFGSSATDDFCSKCYKDHFLSKSKASINTIAVAAAVEEAVEGEKLKGGDVVVAEFEEGNASAAKKRPAGRCGACGKRVGLMGFKCRCGDVYCSLHRYSDKHGCEFDYKGAGQDAIAKANPVVKADKVDKI